MVLRIRPACVIWLLALCAVLIAGLTPRLAAASPGGVLGVAGVRPHAAAPPPLTPLDPLATADAYGRLPLSFEPNRGQTDPSVRFLTRAPGLTAYLTQDGATLALAQLQPVQPRTPGGPPPTAGPPLSATVPLTVAVVRLRFPGAAAAPQIVGQDPLPGTANYLIGNDSTQWITGVPTYGAVAYQEVYPGIDLVYTGTQHQLEYDWQVAPGADPTAIQMALSGTAALSLDGQGNLLVPTAFGPLEQRAPAAYQVINGQPQPVSVTYALDAANGTVHLSVGSYDHTQPLTIDPVLSYASYLGGGGADEGRGVAVDATGEVYLTGKTASTDFPITNSLQGTYGGSHTDAFVSKLNASGTALLYSTYLGGNSDDRGEGIALDASGDAFVTGQTSSTNFPTANALYPKLDGPSDAFVAELTPSGGGLLYSTYLGGSADDVGYAIAVDPAGEALVAGRTTSSDFPTANPLQPSYGGNSDAFVAKLAAGGGSLVYSTYLGGVADDEAYGIAGDAAGDAYVTGRTASPQSSFPLAHALYGTYNGNYDAFVAELTPSGSSLVYSTYLGGTQYDEVDAIAVDSSGAAYVTGETNSSDFPTASPWQPHNKGADDAFVAKLAPGGTALDYSTYLGGSDDDFGQGIGVDAQGRATVAGYTDSTDFPVTNAVQGTYGGDPDDAFVAQLSASGGTLLYSTYLGGSGLDQAAALALDSAGNAYVTGVTTSTDFLTTPGAYQGSLAGGDDAFVAKIATASSGLVPWHPHRTLSLGAGLSLSVDLADGHLDLGAQELSVPARGNGLDLTLDRTWDSTLAQGSITSTAGQGWEDNLTPRMGGVLTGTVAYTDQSGAVWPFVFVGNPSAPGPYTAYDSPPGFPWQLSASSAAYTLTNVQNGATITASLATTRPASASPTRR